VSSAPPTFSSCGGLVTLGHLGAFEPQIYFREDGRTDGGFLGVRYPAGIRNMVNESVQCIPRIMDPHCTVHSKVHLRNSARCSPAIRTHVIPDSIAPCWQYCQESATCSPAIRTPVISDSIAHCSTILSDVCPLPTALHTALHCTGQL
jgi:hypothetical protein